MSSNKLDLFHIHLNKKNYYVFIKEKELWGHINESNLSPIDVDALSRWEIMDA